MSRGLAYALPMVGKCIVDVESTLAHPGIPGTHASGSVHTTIVADLILRPGMGTPYLAIL